MAEDKNMIEFTVDKFKELYSCVKKDDADTTYKGLQYVSWSTAWKYLLLNDPTANYEIIEKPDGGVVWEEYGTFLVKTSVTAFGKTIKMHLPIMDSNHDPVRLEPYTLNKRNIPGLNSRILNDNIMRCLAKNIAMFGIGLPLYVKEDLPNSEKEEEEKALASVGRKPEQPVTTKCSSCGKVITADGKLTAQQVVAGTMRAYGKALCADCGRKAKEAKESKSEVTE